jgi:hypothetical protein
MIDVRLAAVVDRFAGVRPRTGRTALRESPSCERWLAAKRIPKMKRMKPHHFTTSPTTLTRLFARFQIRKRRRADGHAGVS